MLKNISYFHIRIFFLFLSTILFSTTITKKKNASEKSWHKEAIEKSEHKFNVRVLLAEEKLQNKRSAKFGWILESKSGFIFSDLEDASLVELSLKKKITLSLVKGRLAINGKRLSGSGVRISPSEGCIGFGDNKYDGKFLCLRYGKKIYLINEIEIDEYLFSVLRWESWPGWPLEVNKALAITCRTYLASKILDSRKENGEAKRPYDIRATNIDQTYKGVHGFKSIKKAIEETQNVVMTYNEKVICSMYDSWCGGLIPADMEGIDFKKAPYLARDYPCTYCKPKRSRSKSPKLNFYSWRVTYRLSDFEDILRENVENAIPVKDVEISKKDKAGMVAELTVKTNSATLAFSGKKIYSLFKDLKSLCFSIEKKGKNLSFVGRGFGHCCGLCQWGAYYMVTENGCGYEDVLCFYYPGIKFAKIEIA